MADNGGPASEKSYLFDLKRNENTPIVRNDSAQNQNDGTASMSNVIPPNRPRKPRHIVFILCATAQFLTGMAYSLLGPFYPKEAAKKGVSLPLTGFVFGLFNLVIFILSPILGNYLTTIGTNFVCMSGIFLGGCGTLLFGTVHLCPSGTPFLAISIMCRFVGACGFSASTTAVVAIVTYEYSEKVGTALGIMESLMAVGYMLGPVVGGALYDFGGFGVPFYLTGALILTNGVLIYNFLPTIQTRKEKRKDSAFSLLKNPLVVIPMLSVLISNFTLATYDSTIARHLEHFSLSASSVGLIFALIGGIYSVMAPVWGHMTDKMDIKALLIVVTQLVYGFGYLLAGPSPFLPFIPFELWVMCVGPACIGASMGGILIPNVKCMVHGALESGFEDNFDTYALVSGLFNSVYCFGGFVGPVAGGAILEAYGYPILFTVLGMSSISMAFVSLIFFSIRHFKKR